MKLFEISNGHIGESYVRCYAWAESESQAIELMRAKLGGTVPESWKITVVTLMESSAKPFVTAFCDSGWEE